MSAAIARDDASYAFRLSESEWKRRLSSKEYKVLRQGDTESYGTGEYCQKTGYFACRGCGHPLYSAAAKFRDQGWDAFERTFCDGDGRTHVQLVRDGRSYETRCANCGSHLGHVFFGEGHTATNERH